jgi:hypothetical protein
MILVACEGLPALFSFDLGSGAHIGNAIPLEGNPLDVAFVQTSTGSWTLVVSVDNVHRAGSTVELRDDKVSTHARIVVSLRLIECNRAGRGYNVSQLSHMGYGMRMQVSKMSWGRSPQKEVSWISI